MSIWDNFDANEQVETQPTPKAKPTNAKPANAESGSMWDGFKEVSSAPVPIIDKAKEYLGTPYKWGGNSKKGIDCSNYVRQVWGSQGVKLNGRARDQYTQTKAIDQSELQPGDLIFMEGTTKEPGITHVVMYAGGGKIIGASSKSGVNIGRLDNKYVQSHLARNKPFRRPDAGRAKMATQADKVASDTAGENEFGQFMPALKETYNRDTAKEMGKEFAMKVPRYAETAKNLTDIIASQGISTGPFKQPLGVGATNPFQDPSATPVDYKKAQAETRKLIESLPKGKAKTILLEANEKPVTGREFTTDVAFFAIPAGASVGLAKIALGTGKAAAAARSLQALGESVKALPTAQRIPIQLGIGALEMPVIAGAAGLPGAIGEGLMEGRPLGETLSEYGREQIDALPTNMVMGAGFKGAGMIGKGILNAGKSPAFESAPLTERLGSAVRSGEMPVRTPEQLRVIDESIASIRALNDTPELAAAHESIKQEMKSAEVAPVEPIMSSETIPPQSQTSISNDPVVYHGSVSNYDNFDISKSQIGASGIGIYFTDSPKNAEMYGGIKNPAPILKDNWIDDVYSRIKDISPIQGDQIQRMKYSKDASDVVSTLNWMFGHDNIHAEDFMVQPPKQPVNVKPYRLDIKKPLGINTKMSLNAYKAIMKDSEGHVDMTWYDPNKTWREWLNESYIGADEVAKKTTAYLRKKGYDSFLVEGGHPDDIELSNHWVVLDPKIIKPVESVASREPIVGDTQTPLQPSGDTQVPKVENVKQPSQRLNAITEEMRQISKVAGGEKYNSLSDQQKVEMQSRMESLTAEAESLKSPMPVESPTKPLPSTEPTSTVEAAPVSIVAQEPAIPTVKAEPALTNDGGVAEVPKSIVPPKVQERLGALDSAANEARQRIASRGTTAKTGIDPQDLYDYSIIGADYIAKGTVKFAEWSSEMVKEFGETIKPHLKRMYNVSKEYHGSVLDVPADAPKPNKYAENINMNRIDLPEGERNSLRAEIESTRLDPEWEARRKTITQADTEAAAVASPMTLDEAVKIKPGKALNNVDAVRLRNLDIYHNQRFHEARARHMVEKSEASEIDMLKAAAEWRTVFQITSGATAEAGRALNSFKIMAKDVGEGVAWRDKARKQLRDALGGDDMTDALLVSLDRIPEGDNLALAKLLRDSTKMTPWDMVHAYLYGNMLSSPNTQMVNAISNTVMLTNHNLMRGASAAVDSVSSKITGQPRTRYVKEVLPSMLGAIHGIPDGLQRATEVMKNGFDPRAIENADFFGSPELPMWKGNRKIGKLEVPKNPWNAIKRGMIAADAVFKSMAEQSEIYAIHTRQAIQEGLSGRALAERVKVLNEKPTPETKARAAKVAQYTTFQAEAGESLKGILKVRNYRVPDSVAGLGGMQPLKLIVPFMQVGSNMLKIGAEYSPAGFTKLLSKEVRASGEVADVIARASVGSAAIASTIGLMQSGHMQATGSAPKSPKERDAFYAMGKQPYSVKIGGKWYPYQRLGPSMYPVVIAAAFANSMEETNEKPTHAKILNAIGSVSQYTLDQSFFQGLNGLLEAVKDPERRIESFLSTVASQAVPLSSAMRTAAKAVDPMQRQAETIYEKIIAGIPGASKTLPARVNALGKEQMRSGKTGASALWPFSPNYESTDPVVVELDRLQVWPSLAGKKLTIGNQKVELKRGEQRDYAKLKGSITAEQLANLIKSERYIDATDEDRIEMLDKVIQASGRVAQKRIKLGLVQQGRVKPGNGKSIPAGTSTKEPNIYGGGAGSSIYGTGR